LLAGVANREHVRVLDRGREPRLALEPLAEGFVLREFGLDHLEGDGNVEGDVGRPVHNPHAAAPGNFLDAVAGELGPRRQLSHRSAPESDSCFSPHHYRPFGRDHPIPGGESYNRFGQLAREAPRRQAGGLYTVTTAAPPRPMLCWSATSAPSSW